MPEVAAALPKTRHDPGAPRSRYRRALAKLAGGLGLGGVFLVAAAASVLLHLDLAPTRHVVADAVNGSIFRTLFEGRWVVGRIDHLGLDGVQIHEFDAYASSGERVVHAEGIRAEFDAIANVRRIARGEITIVIKSAYLLNAEVLVESHDGVFGLANTFQPRPYVGPPPTAPPGPPTPVRFAIEQIAIEHAWGHGNLAPGARLDADVSRLVASLHVEPDGVKIDVDAVTLEERALTPFPIRGVADYHLRVGEAGAPDLLKMWTGLNGQYGAADVRVAASLQDGVLKGHVHVPRTTPEQVRAFAPALPLRDVVTVSGDIEGRIPSFSIHAKVGLEGTQGSTGHVEVDGIFDATEDVRLVADVHATDVDLGAIAPVTATPANVDARVRVELSDELRATAEVSSQPFTIDGQVIPKTDAFAVYAGGEVDGSATAFEVGAPTTAAFHVSPSGDVRFATQTDVPSLQAVDRIPGAPVSGSARVAVAGTLKGGELDARATGTLSGVAVGKDVSIESGTIDARVRGPVASLSLEGAVTGGGVHAGAYDFQKYTLRASGPVASPHVSANFDGDTNGKVTASGDVDAGSASVKAVKLSIEKGEDKLEGSIERIGASSGGVVVDGVALQGEKVGRLGGHLRVERGELVGRLRGDEVDLQRLTNVLSLPVRVKGLANIDVDLATTPHGRKGHASIEIEDGNFGGVAGVSGLFTATFSDRKVEADGLVRLVAHADPTDKDRTCDGAIARVRMENGSGELDGPLLDARTWARAYGSAKFAAEDFDLHCLARLGPTALFLSDVKGRLGVRFTFERAKGDRFPSVKDLLARTTELEIAGPFAPGSETPTWESRHVDVQLNGEFDGRTGHTTTSVALLDDKVIGLLSITADPKVGELIDEPEKRFALLRQMPLTVDFRVPRRPMSELTSLPSVVVAALPAAVGDVSASLEMTGSLEKPYVSYRAHARGLSAAENGVAEASAWSLPINVEIAGSYDGEQANLKLVTSRGDKNILTSDAAIVGLPITQILDGKIPDWTGSVHADLTDAPIGDIPFFVDRDLTGTLSGSLAFEGLNQRPTLQANLRMGGLQVGELQFDRGSIVVDVTRDSQPPPKGAAPASFVDHAIATVSVDLAERGGGDLRIGAQTGVIWQSGLVPLPDSDAAGGLDLVARRFRLSALHPALMGALSKLDGLLDGSVHLGWKKLAEQQQGDLVVDLKVTKGVLHVPQLGQEFTNAHLTMKSAPGGIVRVDDIGADGGSTGHLGGSAQVKLDGLRFREASASFEIKQGQDLPVNLEGVPLGNFRAKVDLTATKDEKENRLAIQLKIPTLHLELPPSPGRGVQDLDDNPDVKVSHALHEQAEISEKAGTKLDLVVRIDDAVIEGKGLRIALKSVAKDPPHVTIEGGDTRVVGDVHLTSGKLTVFGKDFVVEETAANLIHMAGDASNPYLNVTARWDAPDGTQVYIDYIGPLQPLTADRIKMRSIPSYSPDQIQTALLLGGDFSASQAPTGQSQAGGVATNAAGSVAAQQFNSLLSGIGPLRGLSTRFNTNQDGSLQTSLVYDINDKFSATATIDNGTGTTTGAPGASTSSSALPMNGFGGTAAQQGTRTQLSVDWHFWRNWLVRGSVILGMDEPTSGLDFLWQYRY